MLGVDEIDTNVTPGDRSRDTRHTREMVSPPEKGDDQQHVTHPETEPARKDGPVQDPDQRVEKIGYRRTCTASRMMTGTKTPR